MGTELIVVICSLSASISATVRPPLSPNLTCDRALSPDKLVKRAIKRQLLQEPSVIKVNLYGQLRLKKVSMFSAAPVYIAGKIAVVPLPHKNLSTKNDHHPMKCLI